MWRRNVCLIVGISGTVMLLGKVFSNKPIPSSELWAYIIWAVCGLAGAFLLHDMAK